MNIYIYNKQLKFMGVDFKDGYINYLFIVGIIIVTFNISIFTKDIIYSYIKIVVGSIPIAIGLKEAYKNKKFDDKQKQIEIDNLKQKQKESNINLEFDIIFIDGQNEREVDYYEDDFQEMSTLFIKINIYNPNLIDNVVKNISASTKQNKRSYKLKCLAFSPIKIKAREHITKKVSFIDPKYLSSTNDIISIEITSIDNKKIKQSKEVDHTYSIGNLKEIEDEINAAQDEYYNRK